MKKSFEEKKEKLGYKCGIKMTKELERDLSEMCSLSFGIEEIGIRKGIEQGVDACGCFEHDGESQLHGKTFVGVAVCGAVTGE